MTTNGVDIAKIFGLGVRKTQSENLRTWSWKLQGKRSSDSELKNAQQKTSGSELKNTRQKVLGFGVEKCKVKRSLG